MNIRCCLALLGVLLYCSGRSAMAADPLSMDLRSPFIRPAEITRLQQPQSQTSETTGLQLRATMIAKAWSMANVNGTMLMPGDAIDDYRLVLVLENEAIFVKNGQRVIVTIDDEKRPEK
jgi:hypothetical protein